MALCVELHPVNPQPRLLAKAAEVLRGGGLLVYPTDTCYALGCTVAARESQDRLRRIRQLDLQHGGQGDGGHRIHKTPQGHKRCGDQHR